MTVLRANISINIEDTLLNTLSDYFLSDPHEYSLEEYTQKLNSLSYERRKMIRQFFQCEEWIRISHTAFIKDALENNLHVPKHVLDFYESDRNLFELITSIKG